MRPLTVLVVDDDDGVRRVLERALRLRGHTPLLASRGDAASELLRTRDVDVILMDLRMPAMSGQTLFHVIASQWPDMVHRLIVMSGDPDAEDHVEWLDLHQLPVLRKPFDLDQLFSLLERVVAERRRANNGG